MDSVLSIDSQRTLELPEVVWLDSPQPVPSGGDSPVMAAAGLVALGSGAAATTDRQLRKGDCTPLGQRIVGEVEMARLRLRAEQARVRLQFLQRQIAQLQAEEAAVQIELGAVSNELMGKTTLDMFRTIDQLAGESGGGARTAKRIRDCADEMSQK